MKKLILFLFLLVNVLIFFNVRENFFHKDEVEMMNGEAGYYRAVLVIDNLNNESISFEKSNLIFDRIDEITSNYDVSFVRFDIDFIENRIELFVSSHRPIDEIFNLTTNQSIVFNSATTYFYTNQHDVANGVNFFLLNDRLEVNIFPLRNLGIVVGGNYSFFSDNQEELSQAVQLFMAEFGDLVSRVFELRATEPFNPQQQINYFLTPTIYLSMILSFLLILLYIHRQSSKIAIHKTLGHSFAVLSKEIFFPLILMILLTIILTQTILFITIIGAFNERTIPIITSMFNAVYRQVLGVFVSIAAGCLLLLLVPLHALIKNKKFTRILMTANYLVKIALLVAIIPLFSDRLMLMSTNWDFIQQVRQYERNGNISDYQFSPNPLSRYGANGHMNLMMTLRYDSDSSIIYEHEVLYEFHNAYRILNEAGAIRVSATAMFSGEPVINVNENFLRKYPIIDLDGNVIDLASYTGDFVNLIPEDYQGRAFVRDMYNRGETVIYIQNEQVIFDYSLDWASWGLVRRPYVISVRMDSSFDLWTTPFRNVFFDGDFNELLRDTMFYNRIHISTVGYELNRVRTRQMVQIRDHLFVLTPILALVMLISIQYSYLYVKVYQKRIYTNQIMGHNDFRIFWQLFVELMIGVLASMAIAWYLGIDFRLLMFIIILDLIVYLAVIGWSKFGKSFKFVEHS